MVEVTFSSWSAEPIDTDYNTYVITHGYQSSSSEEWVNDLAQEIDDRDPFSNIILTDWSEAADTLNYFSAVEDTEAVGNQLAIWLSKNEINPDTTQLIGHSLGAHVSGIAGDVYEDITGSSIETIVGLDAAGPAYEDFLFFSGKSPEERLDPTDAERVIAFHTSETFGYDDPLGILDLYINPDDLFQPGEWNAIGNHSYAHQLYTDLVAGNGYRQSNEEVLGDGIFDYEDLFAFSGSIDVDTNNPVFFG
ncbi:MAG: hypothetical protein QNJ32_25575 [Xenococcaceae cyanobacterium MO_167.B27]|nr:hypothetical protein [Xenococcaceae cyanobacterium MO_167.B27]